MNTVLSSLQQIWIMTTIHLWQTTLVLIPLLVLARWLRNAPGRWQELLWTIALAKLFLPLSVCGGLILGLRERFFHRLTDNTDLLFQPAGQVATTLGTVFEPSGQSWIEHLLTTPWPAALLVALTAGWQIGFLWHVIRLAGDIQNARRLGGVAADLTTDQELALGRTLDRVGVPRQLVVVCREDILPAVVGVLRPRILIPHSLLLRISRSELQALLMHEWTHCRRREPLRILLQRLCRAVFFFYPVLFPLLRGLRDSAEYICDEETLASGVRSKLLASTLVRTLRLHHEAVALGASAGRGGTGLLVERLQRLGRGEGNTSLLRHGLLVGMAVLVVAAGSFLPISFADEPPPPPVKAENKDASVPVLIHYERPVYPAEAIQKKISGTVRVRILVDADGDVAEAQVAQGVNECPALDEAALVAARKCRFKPAKQKNIPIKAWLMMPFHFELE